MQSQDYSVRALGLGTPAGRLAYDVVYGDFMRLFRTAESSNRYDARIRPEIYQNISLRDAAIAFLAVFDRYRAFLSTLGARGVKAALVRRLFACPPSGVVLEPGWKTDYYCRKVICPWCRHRQVLEMYKNPWAPLTQELHILVRAYEATTFLGLNEARTAAAADRRLLLRNINAPFIRFQRIGLEVNESRCCYRFLQIVTFCQPVGPQNGWDFGVGTYDKVLELACRFSAANLLFDRCWDMFGELLGLNRLRKAEVSR